MKNATPKAATYSVVVRDPNSWSAATGINLLVRDCGHAHKTPQAADKCAAKLLNYQKGGTHSANWHLYKIERSDGVGGSISSLSFEETSVIAQNDIEVVQD